MRRIDLLIVVCLAALSCRKREYPVSREELGEQVFYFNGTVDGQPIDMRAGDSTYYLFTTYGRDSNQVLNFSGELRNDGCGSCERMKIQINDVVENGNVAGDSAISARNYGFIPAVGKAPVTRFSAAFNGSAVSYKWDFGDGGTSSEKEASHVYARPGPYDVCVTVTGANKCMNTICNSIIVFPDGSSFGASIGVAFTGDQEVKFSHQVAGGSPPYSFEWNFGDGGTDTEPLPTHQYKWRGSYPVKLTVTDSKGQKVVAGYNLVTRNDPSACAANFSMTSSGLENLSLSKVKLTYTDRSNTTYTSSGTDQPGESYFVITGVSDFGANERGESTRLIRVKFRAVLKSDTRQVILASDNSVWAVAVP